MVQALALAYSDPRGTGLPVLFVHGAGGTPRNWAHIAAQLDRDRFHPWFLYYPSGLKIGQSASLLYHVLENRIPSADTVVLVSHSMGGLVSKAALDMYAKQRRDDYLKQFISFSTPILANCLR